MAEIVFGAWTSHGPQLNTTPEEWLLRVPADKGRQHPYKGSTYSFEELKVLRKEEHLEEQSSIEQRRARHARCQAGIKALSERFEAARPDVCVIFGNDQRELMLEPLQPAFTVYYGETLKHGPLTHEQEAKLAPGIKETEWAYRPDTETEYPGLPELALKMVEKGIDQGFDFTVSNEWPVLKPDHWHTGTPHAFAWIFRRIMNDKVVPTLPIITNTFFPPNQPRPWRCFQMGQLVAELIKEWDKDLRVAVFGSGGMSHFVIDEALDHLMIDSIQSRNAEALKAVDPKLMKSGSSELLNWISAAGCLFETELKGDLIDFIPCYRSEAGTGTAQGFICWDKK